ncbi:12825_t:CDS:2 [Ambispora leptoticha]|uniref:12825_t:CDS:1 n=1 Tax=Ambispora leptoticha TaxID=144679 RepID=A0A9N9AJZ1_9GLOM|nr:12825_t:CDS:2 [Ambispora leptoticha]
MIKQAARSGLDLTPEPTGLYLNRVIPDSDNDQYFDKIGRSPIIFGLENKKRYMIENSISR